MLRAAYKFIVFDKTKSIGVVLGIVLSAFLIGQQLGVLGYLMGLMRTVPMQAQAPVWVTNARTKNANALGRMDARLVQELKSMPGVAQAYPVVMASGAANFLDGSSAALTLIGSEAPFLIAGPDSSYLLHGNLQSLLQEGAVTADALDAKNLGGNTSVGTEFEVNGKRAVVGAQTYNARGFGMSIVYTTLERARYLGNFPTYKVSAVLLQPAAGVSTDSLVAQVNRSLYGVKAWKKEDLAAATVHELIFNSGIGVSVGSLIAFALVSGFLIIGLIMYSAALDRLRDYGTLKAIGAGNGYLRRLVLTQALLFALAGFSAAILLLFGFAQGVRKSGLVIALDFPLVATLLGVVLFMCMGGALFALRRISGVEPASVFR